MNRQGQFDSIVKVALGATAVAVVCAALLGWTAAANAAVPSLKVSSTTPEFVTAGKGIKTSLNILNLSSQPIPNVSVKFSVPVGINVDFAFYDEESGEGNECQAVGNEVECTTASLRAGRLVRIYVFGKVDPGASGFLPGSVTINGAGEVFNEPFSFTVGNPGPFAIRELDMSVEDGSVYPADQAGATPSAIDSALLLRSVNFGPFSEPLPFYRIVATTENMRELVAHIPAGVIGDPTATPTRCTQEQLVTQTTEGGDGSGIAIPACPISSQVGLVQVNVGDVKGLYNIEPPPGAPAAFGFYYFGVVVVLVAEVRPDDHGIDLVVERTSNSVPLPRTDLTFWGTPADPIHDKLRSTCLLANFGYNPTRPCPMSLPRQPFLRSPTSCPGTPLRWSVETDTYQHPGRFVSGEATTPATQGCDAVPFDPKVDLALNQRTRDVPSGLDVGVAMPQDRSSDGLGQADLRRATVELPDGVTINAASADGLSACTDAELKLDSQGPSDCPDSSKLGSLELASPLLENPIGGSVYLRTQASKDPESGQLFRLALEIRSDERGVDIKLPGSLFVDEETGRLKTRFDDLPQLPFESMQLHLKTGPRAPLTTPRTCGTYKAHAELEGWNGKTASFDPSLTIDEACSPPPFAPGFEAGVANSTAGEFAPFALRVTRGSGQPNISRIDATLPEGLLAKLAGLPVCGNAQAQSGDCPQASRVGSVVAGIGEGLSPLFLPQAGKSPTAVYFAGPYKGAPYSIVAKVPAQAGPFDLGQVVVRSAVQIDPSTAQVSVASDPLPQIYSGIPVSYRDIRIQIDRPEYTLNPTDCQPKAVTGAISSIGGQAAQVSDRFQVADCASLGFKPNLSIKLKGKARRGGNPALTAVLKMPSGGANIARAVVTLPGSEFIAQDHLDTVCTRVQYAADGGGGAGCPKGSVYGRARAFTPLLDYPLEGPVYLRSNGGDRELPDLVASLDGGIHVDLVGYIDSDKRTGGLRTTFAKVPDAPVSKFVLNMAGGDQSLLENSTNICRGKHRASVKMDGQNGKVHDFGLPVRAKCGKGARGR